MVSHSNKNYEYSVRKLKRAGAKSETVKSSLPNLELQVQACPIAQARMAHAYIHTSRNNAVSQQVNDSAIYLFRLRVKSLGLSARPLLDYTQPVHYLINHPSIHRATQDRPRFPSSFLILQLISTQITDLQHSLENEHTKTEKAKEGLALLKQEVQMMEKVCTQRLLNAKV